MKPERHERKLCPVAAPTPACDFARSCHAVRPRGGKSTVCRLLPTQSGLAKLGCGLTALGKPASVPSEGGDNAVALIFPLLTAGGCQARL